MASSSAEDLRRVLDRQEISAVLARYCRSLDRMDRQLMTAVFDPAATVRYGGFAGTWLQLVDWIWEKHQAFESHSHQMSNIIYDVAADGRSATTESYVSASFWQSASGAPTVALTAAPDGAGGAVAQTPGTQTEVRARYLDQWSRIDGRWAIFHRVCVVDFKTELAAVGLVGDGRRDEGDESYQLGISSASSALPG
jgi:hypothetical protein